MRGIKKSSSRGKMSFSLNHCCFIVFIFLCQPTLVLPNTSNDTSPTGEPEPFLYVLGRRKMQEAESKCYKRMQLLPPYQGEGLFCNRTWDGWLCWDDTPAGVTSHQHCPDYFPDFDPTEKASRICDENGTWFEDPERNKTSTNYSMCNAFSAEKLKNAYILYYLAIVGHSASLSTLSVSLGIFTCFKSLSCQRVTIHKHMFLTYILNSITILIHLIEVVPDEELVSMDPLSCKVLHFVNHYLMSCNYFWMLCEGIYLHTLIVVSVFTEKQNMKWYYLLGWGFPIVPTIIHAVTRTLYFNDNCWLSVETHLLYIIHGPIMAALVVNFFFLLNIIRVLVKKMKEAQQPDSYMYLKAVKATLFLVPLLGAQFVVFPWRPDNKVLAQIYDYLMHSLIHFQGFLVAVIYCFYNSNVQATLQRQWIQFSIQCDQRFGRRNDRRSNNRRPNINVAAAAAAAAAAAEAEAEAGSGLPIYICHQEPRNNEVAVNPGKEVSEVIPMEVVEVVEQETST
ncbi:calcitonin receptor [Desmodus rotundus]|uniref:calcitonin receptor n=1 Tax=Desmodus rotundus TaxID=9430 RepID=UPI001E1BE5F0|nr:calcitonin receptor [Desmodus rotundus]